MNVSSGIIVVVLAVLVIAGAFRVLYRTTPRLPR